MLYINLKHVIWGLQIYNLSREIFIFSDFKRAFTKFAKSIIAQSFAIMKYFAKQSIYSDSPFHVLQNDIQVYVPQNIRKIYFLYKISRTRF